MRKAFAGLFALSLVMAALPASAQSVADAHTVEQSSTVAKVPNFFGSTGLLTIPSAYTQGRRTGSLWLGGNDDFFGGGAVAGIGNRLELGVSVIDFDSTLVFLNAKFALLEEKNNLPQVAVGVVDALDTTGADPSWYVVASKYFTRNEIEQRFALKGHIGYGGGLYDDEIFAGAELFFDPHLSAMFDVANGDFNVGGRYSYKGWNLTVALFDLSNFGGSLAYTVGLR